MTVKIEEIRETFLTSPSRTESIVESGGLDLGSETTSWGVAFSLAIFLAVDVLISGYQKRMPICVIYMNYMNIVEQLRARHHILDRREVRWCGTLHGHF